MSALAQNKASRLRGYFCIAAAALLWGISASLGRAAFTGRLLPGQFTRPIDPLILSQSRTTFSLLVLLPVLAMSRGWQALRLPRRDVIYTFLLGILGVAASNYFYYLAIQRTNVATAIIVQYTAPVWVLLYMVSRGAQKPTAARIAAAAIAVVGCALVIGIGGPVRLQFDSLGLAAAMLAAFSFSFYNIAGHRILERYDRWLVLLWTLLAASLFWLVLDPPWKIVAARYSPTQWGFLLGFSLVSVLGPFSSYFAGLQYLEPTRAIVVSCLEPVFSILIAAAALGELMHPLQTAGILIVLSAIILVQLQDRNTAANLIDPVD
ncbi:MAG: EamA family transporter [Acidobacteriales bacterium]|nr:EamA family transporter [Terriglobales bacterium]